MFDANPAAHYDSRHSGCPFLIPRAPLGRPDTLPNGGARESNMCRIKRLAAAVAVAFFLGACASTPAFNHAAISATDGKDGVTVEARYTCAFLDEMALPDDASSDEALEMLVSPAEAEAQRYCARFNKEPDRLSAAIIRRCTEDNRNWASPQFGQPGTPGLWRALYACVGADEVRIVD